MSQHVWRRAGPDKVVVFDDETLALIEVDDVTARLLVGGDDPGVICATDEQRRSHEEAIAQLESSGVIRRRHISGVRPDFQLAYVFLNISHACDMQCSYCFAGGGEYGQAAGLLMSEEVARAAVDMLAASGYSGPKHMAFFGGEPLANLEVMRFILEYGRTVIGDRTKLGFMLSTNGTALTDEVLQLLADNHVSVQISIDGTSELQNRLRPLRNGGDSFRVVDANLKRAMKKLASNLHSRATVTNLCPDALDLAAQLFALGFRSISLQPVHGCAALELTDQQMEQLGDGYRLLARRGLGQQVSWMKAYVTRVARRTRTEAFCGAGLRGVTAVPDGTLFLCHRLIPLKEFRLGDVWNGVDIARTHAIFDRKYSVDDSMVCRSCLYHHLCGGGCMAENYLETGDIREPWARRCLLTKKVSQAAIDTYLDQRYGAVPSERPVNQGAQPTASRREVPANG